jgi:RNA polymerase sigma-70 factor (ECF subfamily)
MVKFVSSIRYIVKPEHSPPTDEKLIARAQRGDTAAFGDLYERYLTTIFRYVFYRVGERTEAEDLTETVFLKAWEALGRYRVREVPFRAWLYRIAHNTLIDCYRTTKETVPLDEQCELPDPADQPDELFDLQESRAAVTQALQNLPPDYQHVLTLRFISGLSHAETSQVLGRSEKAVRVLQHRALNALRKILTIREVA